MPKDTATPCRQLHQGLKRQAGVVTDNQLAIDDRDRTGTPLSCSRIFEAAFMPGRFLNRNQHPCLAVEHRRDERSFAALAARNWTIAFQIKLLTARKDF